MILYFVLLLLILYQTSECLNSANEENQLSSAQLGMAELAKTMKNPGQLKEALELLKDPEIAAEVSELLSLPKFQTNYMYFFI